MNKRESEELNDMVLEFEAKAKGKYRESHDATLAAQQYEEVASDLRIKLESLQSRYPIQ